MAVFVPLGLNIYTDDPGPKGKVYVEREEGRFFDAVTHEEYFGEGLTLVRSKDDGDSNISQSRVDKMADDREKWGRY